MTKSTVNAEELRYGRFDLPACALTLDELWEEIDKAEASQDHDLLDDLYEDKERRRQHRRCTRSHLS